MINRKIKWSIIGMMLTGLVACQNYSYLDILPLGSQNSENYFNTPEEYNSALIGTYDLLSTTYLNVILGEIASDNALCGGENATDVLAWQQIDDMRHTADNEALRDIFKWMYAGISRANYIMEFKDKIDFTGKDQIIAETIFLRAYYYFELVKFFGDVPMYIDKRISLSEAQSIDRTPKATIYAQLEKDLLQAVDDLPWTQTQAGRATKGAALALLGKIYLYQNNFASAASTLDQVIASGKYSLVSDFSQLFLNTGENGTESVFEVQYFGQEGAGFDCLQCSEGNVAVGFSGPRFNGGDYTPYADGYSFNVLTKELVDVYTSADKRKAATIFDIEAFVATHSSVTYKTGYEHTGYFNHKYIPYAEGNANDPHLTHGNNYRAIRYADVLLMAAEAYNRGALGDDKARDYLNLVRSRAGLSNITSAGQQLTEDIWKERRLELAGEGHRFFDLVRTGKTSVIPNFQSNKNELFPIPRIEIELAGNRWTQNTGY